MGKRLHVVKKHQEYGDYEAFNWKFDEFHSLLDALDCDVCGEKYTDNFECKVENYKKALDILKVYKKCGNCKKVQDFFGGIFYSVEELEDDLKKLGGLDNVLEAMDAFWKERDKKYPCISFVAW